MNGSTKHGFGGYGLSITLDILEEHFVRWKTNYERPDYVGKYTNFDFLTSVPTPKDLGNLLQHDEYQHSMYDAQSALLLSTLMTRGIPKQATVRRQHSLGSTITKAANHYVIMKGLIYGIDFARYGYLKDIDSIFTGAGETLDAIGSQFQDAPGLEDGLIDQYYAVFEDVWEDLCRFVKLITIAPTLEEIFIMLFKGKVERPFTILYLMSFYGFGYTGIFQRVMTDSNPQLIKSLNGMNSSKAERRFFMDLVEEFYPNGIDGARDRTSYFPGEFRRKAHSSGNMSEEIHSLMKIPMFDHKGFNYGNCTYLTETGLHCNKRHQEFVFRKIRENAEVMGISFDDTFGSGSGTDGQMRFAGLYYTAFKFLLREKERERFRLKLEGTFPRNLRIHSGEISSDAPMSMVGLPEKVDNMTIHSSTAVISYNDFVKVFRGNGCRI